MTPLFVPTTSGVSALAELARIPWHSLKNAYTGGDYSRHVVPLDDVAAILAAFADPDEEMQDEAFHGVMGTLYHQGDLFEATAYAVPFLCALAADPPFDAEARLLAGLTSIAEATAYSKNAAVASNVLAAFAVSRPHVERIAARPGRPTVRAHLLAVTEGRIGVPFDAFELDDMKL